MTDQCIQYLEALYGGLSDGWMPIWTGQTKSTEWWQVQHLDDIADMAVKFGQDSDLYHGACVRAQELDAQHRGTAAGALYMPGLWLDIDIKGPAHSEKSLPTTLEEAVNLAYQAPERPTMIVHSGGGIHAWWLFETPLHLGGEETHNAAEQLSKDFQAHMRGVAAQHGWKLDNTSDLARVLRLPGTMNHKRAYREDGKAAPAVHFQESPEEHDDRRHPPRWWREKLQRPEQHGEQADTPPQAGERYLEVASALQYCKGATYEEWRDIGFAVHEAFPGEQGLALFNHWSRTQPNYKDEQDVRSQWEGIKRESGNRIGIGTLFRRAKELGWRCVGLLAKAEDERRLSPRPIAEVAPAALARIKDRVDGKVKPIHFPDEWVAHNDQLESLMHGGWWPGCYILIGNT